MKKILFTVMLLVSSFSVLAETVGETCNGCSYYQYELKAIQASYSLPNNTGVVLIADFNRKLSKTFSSTLDSIVIKKYYTYREGFYVEAQEASLTADEEIFISYLKALVTDVFPVRYSGSAYDLVNSGARQTALSEFMFNQYPIRVGWNSGFTMIVNIFQIEYGHLYRVNFQDGTYLFIKLVDGKFIIFNNEFFDSNGNSIPVSPSIADLQNYDFPGGEGSTSGSAFADYLRNRLNFEVGGSNGTGTGSSGRCSWVRLPSGIDQLTCYFVN